MIGLLPSAPEPTNVPPSPRSGMEPGPSAARGGHPILVVEDDPSILGMVVQILRTEGYPVMSARNGVEGLAAIGPVSPSLILLDMRMSQMDGWEFAKTVRSRGVRSPIVVMTAADNAKRWAEEIGADGFLAKPFEFLDLLTAVERHRLGVPN